MIDEEELEHLRICEQELVEVREIIGDFLKVKDEKKYRSFVMDTVSNPQTIVYWLKQVLKEKTAVKINKDFWHNE